MENAFKDLNVFIHRKQRGILNSLIEKNPLLASVPMKPATHGIYNVYAQATEIQGMQEVDFDAELPTVAISFELGQARLGKIGGVLPIPQDQAALMGGYDRYVNDRLPSIIASAGNTQEKRIYYGGFMKSAIKNGQATDVGGTTENAQYSMVFVHWDQDSTVGLFNGAAMTDGKLFRIQPLNGGNEFQVPALNNAIGRVVAAYTQFGLQLADKRYIHALVNIEPKQNADNRDKIDGLPTGAMIDDAIASVRGEPSSTVIYCHSSLIGKLALKFQLPRQNVTDTSRGVTYTMVHWNNIPFIGTYNVEWGKEAVVNLD